MEPYPIEFRSDVLAACDADEGTHDIAVRFKVSESRVRLIKQRRRETGQVSPRQRHRVNRSGMPGRIGWWRRSPLAPIFISASCKPN